VGPRMFVCGYGLYITNTPYKPGFHPPAGGIADGVPEVLRVVRQQIAAGADVIKMYASTGTDDDVTGFETYNYEEIKAVTTSSRCMRRQERMMTSPASRPTITRRSRRPSTPRTNSAKRSPFIPTGPPGHATPCGREPIPSSTQPTWTMPRLRKWRSMARFTSQRLITTAT